MVDISPKLNKEKVLKELKFDKDGRWAVPIANSLKAVDSTVPPKSVIIKDDTFRESTNMPGAAPSNQQKLELARRLEAIGVTEIVGGHAGLEEQCEFMRMVKEAGLKLMVHSYVDFGDWKRGIEKSVAAHADAIWMPGALNQSPVFAGKLGSSHALWGPDFDISATLETVKAAIQMGKDKGKLVSVGRAPFDLDILPRALETYVKAGADRIAFTDGPGNYTPQTTAHLVRMIRDMVGPDIKIDVHCHDDFGLALANSIEAVRAGADVVDCVLNGYSHRSGNCALDQIVLALEVLYDIRTGIDIQQLMPLCQFASETFGVPIPPQAPHIGVSAYSYGGVHIGALLQEGWFVWETVRAEAIGQRRYIVWTPTSLERHGIAGPVALKIRSMGFQVNESQLQEVFARMRKVMAQKRFATDDELEAVVQEVLGK